MAGLLDCPSDDKVLEYIKNQENFIVEGRKQKESVKQVESLLENAGYTVRVKTKGRGSKYAIYSFISIQHHCTSSTHTSNI